MPNECKYKKDLSDSLFCKTAGYYCTTEQESTCKEKSITAHEMTATEAAEILEIQKKHCPCLNCWPAFDMGISAISRVASGKLAPVTHSHWNRINRMATGLQDEFRCNMCGWPVKDATKRCPECGAIMDEPVVSQTQDGKDDEDAEVH